MSDATHDADAPAFVHETVLPDATVDAVAPRSGGLYVDVTVGGGGHTARLLERSAPFLDDINELPNGKRVTGLADPDGVLIEIREA